MTGISRQRISSDGATWFSHGESRMDSYRWITTELDAGTHDDGARFDITGAGVPVRPAAKHRLKAGAGGEHPVRLSYHWIDAWGSPVVWDGPRSALPFDVAPGADVLVAAAVRAPETEGAYTLAWDMVQDGIGWFSGHAVPTGRDLVTVSSEVTFYGKGWGHGIGLSQWGAQGWAEGATGVRLSGEQIVGVTSRSRAGVQRRRSRYACCSQLPRRDGRQRSTASHIESG